MIRFLDGPAAGQVLDLRRAPVFLRVVVSAAGTIDALDDPNDQIRAGEKPYVYILQAKPIAVHVCARGRDGRRISGWRASGDYAHLAEAVAPGSLRDNESWREWVEANKERLAPKWVREAGVKL